MIKNNNDTHYILVTCAKGNAAVLEQELINLGFPIKKTKSLGVFTEGTFNDTISLNMQLRTGLRVLYEIAHFRAPHPDQLYKKVMEIEWEKLIDAEGYFSVTSSVQNKFIKDTRFANLRVKDGIVDRFIDLKGMRPNSGSDRSKAVIFLYWIEDSCTIYLDTTGEPLSKRGYRKIPIDAPMQEALAASLILSTNWDGNSAFINPMCGSGTLAIEAALIGQNKAPGLLRNNFSFMHYLNYDAEFYQKVRKELRQKVKKTLDFPIIATDKNPQSRFAVMKNAETAGVAQFIQFNRCNFEDTDVPEGEGVVVLNPPYGMRLNEEQQLISLYSEIGDFFKQKCSSKTGYIFTGNLNLAKKVGLKTASRSTFYNGKIECRLLEYELYDGTRKKNKIDKKPNHNDDPWGVKK